jgi:hypothetical protein
LSADATAEAAVAEAKHYEAPAKHCEAIGHGSQTHLPVERQKTVPFQRDQRPLLDLVAAPPAAEQLRSSLPEPASRRSALASASAASRGNQAMN